jgi:DNA repair protein RadD
LKLRERQVHFVDRSIEALGEHGNTVGVAPTGAGKTVMLAKIAAGVPTEGVRGKWVGQPVMILQHRDELIAQNRTTFELANPGVSTGIYTADRKEQGYGAIFGMVQTLSRPANLDKLQPVAFLGIDEAHHTPADSYRKVIDRLLKLYDRMVLFGTSATPNRGDGKALRSVYSNCSDQITLKELIDARLLVPPRCFVIDIGVQAQLSNVKKLAADFDMSAVEKIMDKDVLNDRIVEEWRKVAGQRQTVVFCSTVAHAEHVRAAFVGAGITAALIDGNMPDQDRAEVLRAYDQARIQVIVNVAVLTEGWDHQPTSCVVLLRPSSYKSTMMQMIGRGLRKVDPERYPGRHKDDCIVLDFGTSILTHGDLNQDVNLDQEGTKVCPACEALVPAKTRECPICGFEFPRPDFAAETKQCGSCQSENALNARVCKDCGAPFNEKDEREVITDFVMTEVDIMRDSPYRWEPIFDGLVIMACALDAWACIVPFFGRHACVGGARGERVTLLGDYTDRLMAIQTADDYMRQHGDTVNGSKMRAWLNQPASEKQLQQLKLVTNTLGVNKYQAACRITWNANEGAIRDRLEMSRRQAA